MTAIDEIDLEYEKRKLKDSVAVIDEAIENKKLADVEKEAVTTARKELAGLTTKLSTLEREMKQLVTSQVAEVKDHHAKKLQWQEKNGQKKCIVFDSEDTSTSGSENENDSDDRIKLAQENADLLKQQRAIRNISKNIKVKSTELKDIQELISAKQVLLSKTAHYNRAFATVLEKVQLLCHPDQELAKAMKLVEARNQEISVLQDSNAMKAKSLKECLAEVVALKSRIEDQEIVNDHQQSLIAPLLTSFQSNETFQEDNTKSTTQNMAIAFQKGRELMARDLLGLTNAGRYIRSRKLEWQSTSAKNETLVAWGNKASHYGMALADATLYQDKTAGKRSDPQVFVGLYGVKPDFVWKNRYCNMFLDILDWRGTMKDFHSHKYASGSYEVTKFCHLSRGTFASFVNEPNVWTLQHFTKFFEEEKGKTLHEDLKKEYTAGLKKHTAYQKQQKDRQAKIIIQNIHN